MPNIATASVITKAAGCSEANGAVQEVNESLKVGSGNSV